MKIDALQKDNIIVDWFDAINPSAGAIKAYLSALQGYTEFTGKTPEELINEAEAEICGGVLPRKRSIKRHLNEFRNHLQDKELGDFLLFSGLQFFPNYAKQQNFNFIEIYSFLWKKATNQSINQW